MRATSLDRGGRPFVLQIGGPDWGRPEIAIPPDHTVLGAGHGFPPITDTEVALVAAPEASAGSRQLCGASGQLLSHARSPGGGMTGSALLQAPLTTLGRQLPGTVRQPVLHWVTEG
jgi:hypothetical protein